MYEFYNSKEWRRLSKLFLKSKHFICERCGGVADVAHHKIHLNKRNVNNPDISLNMVNLQSLCLECHNAIHSASMATAAGVCFDSEGNLVKIE
jgi:5-methylcytosine-specific restriction endonuclease McrA